MFSFTMNNSAHAVHDFFTKAEDKADSNVKNLYQTKHIEFKTACIVIRQKLLDIWRCAFTNSAQN